MADSSRTRRLLRLAPLFILTLPYAASAQSLTQAAGLFNIFVGLMLVAALLTYGLAFVMWVSRLGTWPSNRTEAIKIMEWAVAILFVLIVLLGVVQFFRDHAATATYITGAVILALIVWAVFMIAKGSGEEEEEKH